MYRGNATFWATRHLLKSDELIFVEGVLRFRRVLVANGGDKTHVRHTSKHLRSNIGTPWVVAEIFDEQFFVPVWSREVRLYRYWRNGKSLNEYLHYPADRGLLRK
jgi:hypothetical protein